MRALGRRKPPDWKHVENHPFSAIASTLTKPTPVVAGTEWLTGFDVPTLGQDGKYRIPLPTSPSFGTSRGGHCYCFEPAGEPDAVASWTFYDQGESPACEGFGNSRAMTLLRDGELFDARWLYDDARRAEGAYPEGEGSTNRAAAEALHRWGDHPAADVYRPVPQVIPAGSTWEKGVPSVGIASFHWITSVEELRQALGFPGAVSEFPFLNSWGRLDYPHRVYASAEVIDWHLQNEGEFTVLVSL